MTRFQFEGSEKALAEYLQRTLTNGGFDENKIGFVIAYIAAHADEDARVEHGKSSTSEAGLDWRVNHVVIDVPNALIVSAAAAVDALWSRGAAMALLAASGRDLRAWASLNAHDGGFCNFVSIEEKDGAEAMSPSDVTNRTAGHQCIHPDLSCNFDFEGACCITPEAVANNLAVLEKRKLIELNDAGAAIRVR